MYDDYYNIKKIFVINNIHGSISHHNPQKKKKKICWTPNYKAQRMRLKKNNTTMYKDNSMANSHTCKPSNYGKKIIQNSSKILPSPIVSGSRLSSVEKMH